MFVILTNAGLQVDKHHGLHLVDDRTNKQPAKGSKKLRQAEDEDDDYSEEEAPVFDLDVSNSDDENEDDEDDDDSSNDELSNDDDDEEFEEQQRAAIEKEEKVTTAWGKKKSTFYDADSDAEIDEDAAAAEEEEALRLQQKRTAELDDDDAAFGVSALTARQGGSSKRASTTSASKTSIGSAAAPSSSIVRDASKLTKSAKMDILMSDAPELVSLLTDMKERTAEVKDVLVPILDAVKSGKLPTSKGIAYLEVKHSLLLSYITDIAFVLLLRAEGRSVRDHPVIEQLVHVRALLERMRPLDARLSGQVQRLLRAAHATEQGQGTEDGDEEEVDMSDLKGHPALMAKKAAQAAKANGRGGDDEDSSRPNPAALLAHGDVGKAKVRPGKHDAQKSKAKAKDTEDEDMEAGESDEDDFTANLQGMVGKDGVFRPLRRAAVPFDGDKPKDKASKEAQRAKDRAMRSDLLADIQATYSSAPEVEGTDGAGGGRGRRAGIDDRLDALAEERRDYEEDMLTRVTMSKVERKQRLARERERERHNNLSELEAFGDLDDITRAADAADELGAAAASRTGRAGGPRTLAQLEAEAKVKGRLGAAVQRAADTGMAAAVGRKSTSARGAAALEVDSEGSDNDAQEGPPKGRLGGSHKRGRMEESDDDEIAAGANTGTGEDDEFYTAIAEAAAAKKARKAAQQEAFEEDKKRFIRSRMDQDTLGGPDAKRKLSREIKTNRGLVKYRKKEERNPRVHNRMKAEKFMKRRKGQVVTMRDKATEEGRYGGEETGIRTGVVRSRKIRG